MRLSFCATNLNTADKLAASIASVDALGNLIGRPYEIVVADGPSTDGATEKLAALAKTIPRFRHVRHAERNRGFGRRLAFEQSSGDIIVPFDTSIVYDPTLAELLRRYLNLGTGKMLFSEIVALPRSAILDAGSWRDLIGGEDIDLYARVVLRAGLIAYPLALPTSQSERLSSYQRQMRYIRASRMARLRRIYAVQRDQKIGLNATVHDLLLFNGRKPLLRRAALAVFFALTTIGGRFRGIPPVRLPGGNNYLIVRGAILRSLVAREFDAVGWPDHPARLLLTEDEIFYLSHASEESRRLLEAARPYVGVK